MGAERAARLVSDSLEPRIGTDSTFMFSSRGPGNRDPNSFSRAVAAAQTSGHPPLDLTVSNPTSCGFHYDFDVLAAALGDPAIVRYQPGPLGLQAARDAVVGRWADRGIATTPDRVLLTASTSEAYAFLFKLLCDPGDEVLAPQPSYPLFELLAGYEAVRLVPCPLRYDGSWHVDLDGMRAARTSRTRAILVVSPNNPTGSYLSRLELRALLELGLPIICDEVFADYPLREDPHRARSVLEATSGLVFALDGLSKAAALPQLKLGWITAGGDAALVEQAMSRLEIMADSYLSVGTPVQHAAPRLLGVCHAMARSIAERLQRNLRSLTRACAGTAATVLDVEGGWYAVLRLPAVATEEEWVAALLDDGVVVQPGWFFDFSGEPFVVISLLTPEERLRVGADKIRKRVNRWCG